MSSRLAAPRKQSNHGRVAPAQLQQHFASGELITAAAGLGSAHGEKQILVGTGGAGPRRVMELALGGELTQPPGKISTLLDSKKSLFLIMRCPKFTAHHRKVVLLFVCLFFFFLRNQTETRKKVGGKHRATAPTEGCARPPFRHPPLQAAPALRRCGHQNAASGAMPPAAVLSSRQRCSAPYRRGDSGAEHPELRPPSSCALSGAELPGGTSRPLQLRPLASISAAPEGSVIPPPPQLTGLFN